MPQSNDYAFTADSARATTHDAYMYAGALSFCRRLYSRNLAGADVAVVGVPFDTAVTNRPGCRLGPRAIRAASVNLGWARAWPSTFDPFERLSVVDWGDLPLDHGHPAQVPDEMARGIGAIIGEGPRALLLGGDHYISYPSLKAHAAKHGRPLSVIQFDAHTDTWDDDGGSRIDHGTMFRTAIREGLIDPATSIQIGIRTTNDDPMGVEIFDAIRVHEEGWKAAAAAIRARVGDRPAYVTFDIDGLDPSQAPGTGTPVVGGMFSHQALAILRSMAGMNVVGADVVEVSPAYDVSEITALAGATIAVQMLCLFAEAQGLRP